MQKSMIAVSALALVASAVIAAPKPQAPARKAAPKTKATMQCPMMGSKTGRVKQAGTAKKAGSGMMGGCCAGMMGNMPGMKGTAPATPAVTSAGMVVQAKALTTVVGSNDISVSLRQGTTPVTGATVTLTSAMTSMDMGTEKVTAKETAPGQYRAAVHFSMGGPWRVTVTATKGGQTNTTTLDLNAQ